VEQRKFVGALIKKIHDTIAKNINNETSSCALTFSQTQLLFALESAKDATMTFKELEKEMGIAQSTTAGIISRLEPKGFVKTLSVDDDKRIRIARLTTEGIAICKTSHENIENAEEKFLKNFTSEERSLLYDLLLKLYGNVNNMS
jgi:DNA-binding MarR family transcriptional regulator